MKIRVAEERDIEEILDIYNYEVLNSVSTFDLFPKSIEEQTKWFLNHNKGNHPLIVAEDNGKITGYASLSPYREKEAYISTVELSVYVKKECRGQKIATALMSEIIDIAKNDGVTHTIVSVITSGNEASCRLHAKFGFEFCGTIREVGVKFDRFLDIDNYSLIL